MISIVVPVRRDPRVRSAVRVLSDWTSQLGIASEILVCGELNGEKEILPARLIKATPAWKGMCVREGIRQCHGSIVLVCDADVPVPLEDLTKLLEALHTHDVATAVRRTGPSDKRPFFRRLASGVYRRIACSLLKLPSGTDPQCGVKAFRAEVARKIFEELRVTGFAYDSEVMRRVLEMEVRVTLVPVQWSHSTSTVSIWRQAPRMLYDLLRLWTFYELKWWRR